MIKYENECVGCALPCIASCRYYDVAHYYCDDCGEETDIYEFEDYQLCINCIEKYLTKIN